jgi:hypothetical protein
MLRSSLHPILASLIVGSLLGSFSVDARADGAKDPETSVEDPSDGGAPTALAAGATIVPGLALHGAGTWVDGDQDTGEKLLAMEGVGLGLILVGGVPIGLTGASRYIVGPAAATTIVGFGLFTVSWAADVYAVAAPPGGFGRSRGHAPWIQTELGYRYVYDPRFEYRHFLVQGIDFRSGAMRFAPTAWWSTGTNNARLRILGGYRVAGPKASSGKGAKDGSALDLEAALTRHDYGQDGFVITTAEVFVRSRMDLQRVAKPLAGSFLEVGLGGAVQRFSWEIPGQDVPADLETMLLARFGFGMYVGGPSAPDGELLLYYDHRHDDFAAGLLSSLPTSGVLGHFGCDARVFATDHWGVAGQAQVGSALVTGLSLVFREDLQ